MAKTKNQLKEGEEGINGTTGEGAGGGGGMFAKAKGVYEITPKRTRFIPALGKRDNGRSEMSVR